MGAISLTRASLVALWMETLLYGVYIVLYVICMYILLYRRRAESGTPLNKPMVVTATAMFLLSSMHVLIDLVRALKAFIDAADETDGALEYYAEIWNWLSIFKQAIYATNNILADGLVVYRCYVVWGRSWKIVVLPVTMLIATTVCGYLAVYNFSQVTPGQNVFANNIAQWGTALFSISLATNIIVTTFIAARIWWISRGVRQHLGKRHSLKYANAMEIVIESGAIYAVSLMTLLILYCVQTNAQYIVYDSLAQIMGIVPTMIIVRIGLGMGTDSNSGTFASTHDRTPASRNGTGSASGRGGTVNLPIVIRRDVETTSDRFEPGYDGRLGVRVNVEGYELNRKGSDASVEDAKTRGV